MSYGESGVSAALRCIVRLENSVAVMEVARRPEFDGRRGECGLDQQRERYRLHVLFDFDKCSCDYAPLFCGIWLLRMARRAFQLHFVAL
jgi:hypothetical protein